MTEKRSAGQPAASLQDLVAEADTGGRAPKGIPAKILFFVPVAWSLFQLWIASPLPFVFNVFILNDTQTRSIHLAFAVFLTFLAFPAFKKSPRRSIPIQDWVFAALGAFAAGYLFLFYREVAARPGLPTTLDTITAIVGGLLLLEAARRSCGPALAIVAIVFLGYVFLGPYLPGMVSHKGASLSRAVSQFWLTTEGVFGVALGVSSGFVFLFVLFGALLEKAGAGNYFIKLSFALLGHLRGGPAKAAVASSGLTGLISGSSIANVVTTGTFTIPLMKRVGYTADKAGAVEVAASVNGQIMPPVMGAAAFLMAEYVGISYVQVVKHAFVPAIITYLALFYVVHIEALKASLQGIPKQRRFTRVEGLLRALMTVAGFIVIAGVVYYGIGWTKEVFGAAATWAIAVATFAVYVGLIAYRARYPDLEIDDPNAEIIKLPEAGLTAKTGLHYLLPVVVLVWCLMVEHLSPGLSAFWATVLMIFILVTQRPLTQFFRGDRNLGGPFQTGVLELLDGLAMGARNMIGIGVATAAAGIVVGTVTLTGIGLVMTELVEFLSGGNLLAMLLLTAVICLILGMGLPTTANYIVVATLMAPVIVELAAQGGLAVPLIAVHMFVFYFGLMADVTPPVGLASFAASAISGADPIRTGVTAFSYEIRTALLPFIFIFNQQLILIDIDVWWEAAFTIAGGLLAMLVFVAATQGYFFVRNRWYETALLLLTCFTLFRPGFWMDMMFPRYVDLDPKKVFEIATKAPKDGFIELVIAGETRAGKQVQKAVKLRLGDPGPGEVRLKKEGLELAEDEGKIIVENVAFRTQAAKQKIELDWELKTVRVDADAPSKFWMFIPALAVLGFVVMLQRVRRAKTAPAAA
jgi:TRAP transporter 4TM/12TM fusion protein